MNYFFNTILRPVENTECHTPTKIFHLNETCRPTICQFVDKKIFPNCLTFPKLPLPMALRTWKWSKLTGIKEMEITILAYYINNFICRTKVLFPSYVRCNLDRNGRNDLPEAPEKISSKCTHVRNYNVNWNWG